MSDTHAATETDGEVKPAPEDKGEQKSLQEILDEYPQVEAEKAVQKIEPQPPKDMDRVLQYVERQERKDEQAEIDTSLSAAVEIVRGDGLDLTDKQINDLIYAKFSRDDTAKVIWHARGTNPGPYQEVLMAMGRDFRATKPVDPGLSENQALIRTAAVSGTTRAPEVKEDTPKAILDMNDSDFELWMEKNK